MRRAAIALIFASVLVPVAGRAAATCSGATPGGGEWTLYGHDSANTRSQPLEDKIGTSNVGSLAKKWAFHAVDSLGAGDVTSTPIVADGCVFVTSSVTDAAAIFALNADTGDVVWSRGFDGGDPGALVGGAAVGSPAVWNGTVYMLASRPGSPYVMALDENTGVTKWTNVIATDTADPALDKNGRNTFINASAVVVNGMLIAGFSGYEAQEYSRGGYSVFNATTGELLARTYTIPDAEYQSGHGDGGASVWATPAADPGTGFAYVGTGNPSSDVHESRLSNSLLKTDLRPGSQDFGAIVAGYHGNADSYIDGLHDNPACANQQIADATRPLAWSYACGQMDLDFGASPNLFTDSKGHTLVGAIQKSGIFHAVYADTMSRAWTSTPLGTPCISCNADSAAFDGHALYVAGVPGSILYSLSAENGAIRWASPLLDGVHYQSISFANGVVYTVDGNGFLDGFDASTGLPALKQQIGADTGNTQESNISSSGVAIARHMVYAAVNGWVVSYGL